MWAKIHQIVLLSAITVAISGLVVSSAAAANQLTGAIFTTNSIGTTVNQNHFPWKESVYLSSPCLKSKFVWF